MLFFLGGYGFRGSSCGGDTHIAHPCGAHLAAVAQAAAFAAVVLTLAALAALIHTAVLAAVALTLVALTRSP